MIEHEFLWIRISEYSRIRYSDVLIFVQKEIPCRSILILSSKPFRQAASEKISRTLFVVLELPVKLLQKTALIVTDCRYVDRNRKYRFDK